MAANLSVVIPIYNVEPYIERCARTLFGQTLDGIEYIFVNDCTPDNSIRVLKKVLEDYPNLIPNVRIINHKQNQGVSCSRIDGMKAANGKYIIHCDTDDWLDLDLYEKMFNKAEYENADICVCDFVNEYNDGQSFRTSCSVSGTPKQMLANMHNKSFYCMLWRSMMKRDFVEKNFLYPVPHVDLWEDVYVTLRAYYFANKVVKIDDSVYHYYVNDKSLTANSANPKHFRDMASTVKLLESFFSDKKDIDTALLLSFWKLLAKSTLLTTSGFDPKRWKEVYPESSQHILRIKSLPLKSRIIYGMTSISTLPVQFLMKIYKLLK